jgi:hypothetical protein
MRVIAQLDDPVISKIVGTKKCWYMSAQFFTQKTPGMAGDASDDQVDEQVEDPTIPSSPELSEDHQTSSDEE